MMVVKEGDLFPRTSALGDFGGRLGRKPLVVFFYVAAATGG